MRLRLESQPKTTVVLHRRFLQVPEKFNLRQARHVRERIVLKCFHAKWTADADHCASVIDAGKAPVVLNVLAANHADRSCILITNRVFDVHSGGFSQPAHLPRCNVHQRDSDFGLRALNQQGRALYLLITACWADHIGGAGGGDHGQHDGQPERGMDFIYWWCFHFDF